jgi:hypothetical protein
MSLWHALSLALTALFATGAYSEATLSNSGTLSGWSGILKENKGTVQVVKDVYLTEPSSIKVTQTYDAGWSGRYHSEVHTTKGYKRGDHGFYGFAFRLAPDWQFSPAQNYNLGQFIADFTSTGCDDWMPSTMVFIVGDKLATRVKTGSVCKQTTVNFKDLATVKGGVWYQVVIEGTWMNDSKGALKMWLNGKKILDKEGIATTVSESAVFQYHVGLYANGWHDDKTMKGTQATRTVWYDEIAIGQTYEDVSGGNSTHEN